MAAGVEERPVPVAWGLRVWAARRSCSAGSVCVRCRRLPLVSVRLSRAVVSAAAIRVRANAVSASGLPYRSAK